MFVTITIQNNIIATREYEQKFYAYKTKMDSVF